MDYTPKDIDSLAICLFDSINPIVKALVILFLHWRYKTIALGNTFFDLLKGFLLEVDLPH
jgi:hypothetical protein